MPKLATCCSIFVAKKTGVLNAKIYFSAFLHQLKNADIKAFMKLTPGVLKRHFEKKIVTMAINNFIYFVKDPVFLGQHVQERDPTSQN